MANITITNLRDEVLDRLDNSVVLEQLSENMRTKLKSKTRITRAINQGILMFCLEADSQTLDQLIAVVSAAADANIGADADGVSGGIKTYKWPADAFSERADGGILKLIINNNEYDLGAPSRVTPETLRYMAGSAFYGDGEDSFAIDFNHKRIYSMDGANVKALIVKTPERVADDNTYGSANDAEIPISETFFETVAHSCFAELVKTVENVGAAENALAAQPPGEPQPEAEQ